MSLVITRSKPEATDSVKHEPLHLLPCKIHPGGDQSNARQQAPVDRFFSPYTDTDPTNVDSTTVWHASLRGRPLTGVRLNLPDDYVGVLCSSSCSEVGQESSTGTNSVIADPDDCVTNNFMYWNWDRIPTREDPMLSALDWIRVSEALMTDDE